MKNGSYESRKEQIERGFIPKFLRQSKLKLTPKQHIQLKAVLRDAAMVAAVEERSIAIRLVGQYCNKETADKIFESIHANDVLTHLGYKTDDADQRDEDEMIFQQQR